eukprot:CAMPEP_0198656688 /NCGR_PEP_ID=MMETSP1467-20131203/10619_1 /TAXON_ID=1462469 /ORGANISM="unid. sp., Strain CCMP2135" /LENGTH=158 /DNA_ID=CAMNT_0044392747 /DNA_START=135 /DNA_END=611 /DNA_ORIENTATION=+
MTTETKAPRRRKGGEFSQQQKTPIKLLLVVEAVVGGGEFVEVGGPGGEEVEGFSPHVHEDGVAALDVVGLEGGALLEVLAVEAEGGDGVEGRQRSGVHGDFLEVGERRVGEVDVHRKFNVARAGDHAGRAALAHVLRVPVARGHPAQVHFDAAAQPKD